MARTRVQLNREAIAALAYEPGVLGVLMEVGGAVRAVADSSASDAAGTSNASYASAGFTAELEKRSRRPRVIVRSNATDGSQWRVHFSTIKRWGVAHLRRALYSQTTRGG